MGKSLVFSPDKYSIGSSTYLHFVVKYRKGSPLGYDAATTRIVQALRHRSCSLSKSSTGSTVFKRPSPPENPHKRGICETLSKMCSGNLNAQLSPPEARLENGKRMDKKTEERGFGSKRVMFYGIDFSDSSLLGGGRGVYVLYTCTSLAWLRYFLS